MKPQAGSFSTKAAGSPREELRQAELGPALKRDRLLQRVRAAGRRLPRNSSGAFARLR
jgi:hypothetical protein